MISPLQTQLILASGSPRRADLLREMGVTFEVRPAPVKEVTAEEQPDCPPRQLVEANARLKAYRAHTDEVAAAKDRGRPGLPVLAADTLVTQGRRIFGKPADLDEARATLQALSGRIHEVMTAVVFVEPLGQAHSLTDSTRVHFRKLSHAEIARYLDQVSVLDKAGAYGIQEHGEWLVEAVEGSRNNVIGLPTERLGELAGIFQQK